MGRIRGGGTKYQTRGSKKWTKKFYDDLEKHIKEKETKKKK